jgi:hypothetical protein
VNNDKVGAERRQSNDRMLIESFIVAIAETQCKSCVQGVSEILCLIVGWM